MTVNTAGGGGGWSILHGVGCLHACLLTLSCHSTPTPPFPPSCPCRKAALAGGSREAGMLAFPTCLKSGTWKWPEDLVQCDLILSQAPWSLRPEAALGRGFGLQKTRLQLCKHQIKEGITWIPSLDFFPLLDFSILTQITKLS